MSGYILFPIIILLMMLSCQPVKQEPTLSNNFLIVGTYTQKEGHVDGKADGIYILRFAAEKEIFEPWDTIFGITNPSYVAFDEQKGIIYAASEVADPENQGFGWIFEIPYNPVKREKGTIRKFSTFGAHPCFIATDGSYVFAANFSGGNIVFYPLDEKGLIQNNPMIASHEGSGPSDRQEKAHAHSIRKHPSKVVYYAADLGTDEVLAYSVENKLILEKKWSLNPGNGPRHLDFHPHLPVVYTNNELSGTISVIEENVDRVIQEISFMPEGTLTGASGADIHISQDARFLYVTNRGTFNEIVIFAIDEKGTLSLLERESTRGLTPRNFVLHPSGDFLLVANQDEGGIAFFTINKESGLLKWKKSIDVPTPVCLVF